jgi:hypothetical protein
LTILLTTGHLDLKHDNVQLVDMQGVNVSPSLTKRA